MMSKKSPQLRFEGFTDDWEERKLGELLKSAYQGINTAGDKVIYSEKGVEILQSKHITSGYITFDDTRFLDKKRYSEYFPKYVPKKHDILFANIGTIGPSTVVETNKEFLIAWNILKMTPNENVNSKFIELFLQILNEKHYYEKITTGNATKFVNKDAILNIELCTSSFKEQQKIGSFFQQLDNTIALHQRKLDLLKEQKKGYLQKMFPKNGAKVPELRFAGFADDWEERKLSSGLREYTDRVIVEDDKEYYQISVRNNFGGITLRGSKMGNKIGRKRQAKINLTKYPQTLIFTRQTVEQGGIGWVDKYCDGAIVTENMPTISLDTSVFSKYFLTNLFQTRIFYKNAILDNIEGGSAQIAIHESKFLSSTLLFPNLDEQEKIGQFFKQLDDTIDLHQRKLDLLKEQKKGFLQKMFV